MPLGPPTRQCDHHHCTSLLIPSSLSRRQGPNNEFRLHSLHSLFSGKVLSVTCFDDISSCDLFSPCVEMQGKRLFVVGTVPSWTSSSNWAAGSQSAIAWDRVNDYIVFDTLEKYGVATAISSGYHDENAKSTESDQLTNGAEHPAA